MAELDFDLVYDLVVVGGTAGGLSVAISSQRSGVQSVRVISSSSAVTFPELVRDNQLDIGYGEKVEAVDANDDGTLSLRTSRHRYRARAVLLAHRPPMPEWSPPIAIPNLPTVKVDTEPENPEGRDVLVIGYTDHAVELAATIEAAGGNVVLAAGGMDPDRLSPAADNALRRMERERRITILYRSIPDEIDEIDGHPMAYFNDRRTPDLQFDDVVIASHRRNLTPAERGVTDAALATGKVWFLGEPDDESVPTTAPGHRIGLAMAECFPELDAARIQPAVTRRHRHEGAVEELRDEHYNATITHFEPTHSDLWVLRVTPDHGGTDYTPGQYATLGLGFWEERIDDAIDPNLDDRWFKLIRRSYSISSRVLDDHGYLVDEGGLDELEFYIVLVPPTDDNIPELTPRLALKRPGDRIYLGPKVAGRYTLDAVTNPAGTVMFFSTGTGEAPHNAMVTELLRKGHHGPIVSAVSVRNSVDLGYIETHRELERRHQNYHYLPMPTREPDVAKRYIQDLITDGDFASMGVSLDPATTHVFMCGNPAMIGIPDEHGAFPATTGVVELLVERGFTIDKRKQPGNIHYEEYW
ncbi:MAG: NAD(P)-binding domain-containing protein [Actinomycetota bacterium]